MEALPFLKMMSTSQLISSLGKELEDLRARVASLEGLLGVSGVSAETSSNTEGSCRMCGITWQLGVTCLPQHMAGRRHKANLARANLARLSNNPPSFSSKKGTGHTEYRATMCNKDILNGMAQIQGNVLGRLQSITCMKEYKRKSFEELHWEDLRIVRRGLAENLVNFTLAENLVYVTLAENLVDGTLGKEGGGASCKTNEGVKLKEKKGADDEVSALTKGVQEDGPAVEVNGECVLKPDQVVAEELHLADHEVGRRGLTKHSLLVTDGASLKEGCSVGVKDGSATSVVDEKWDKVVDVALSKEGGGASCKENEDVNLKEKKGVEEVSPAVEDGKKVGEVGVMVRVSWDLNMQEPSLSPLPHLITLTPNGLLPLAALLEVTGGRAITGLRYRRLGVRSREWRSCLREGDMLHPPPGGWNQAVDYVVFADRRGVLEDNKGGQSPDCQVQMMKNQESKKSALQSKLISFGLELEEAGSADGGNVDRKSLVAQIGIPFVMLKPDQLVSEELQLAYNNVGRKGLTKHSSGSPVVTDGASLKEGCSVDVKDGTATSVVDEKLDTLAATEEPDQSSPAVSEIISIRPRLRRPGRKV